jgi:hypothetical protein
LREESFMTDVDQLLQSLRRLPVPERLRLVEQVIHELADAPFAVEPAESAAPSPLGLFADDPAEVDEMMKIVRENRRR